MNKDFINNIKNDLGYSIIGEYLKGTGAVTKSIDSDNLGKLVCEEKFVPSGEKELVDYKNYDSPAISCGVLSNIITTVNDRIDAYSEALNDNLGYGNHDKKETLLKGYAEKILNAALPIAFAEGEDDDDLKTDIRVLLKQSKEEFEKRVEENKEEEDIVDEGNEDDLTVDDEDESSEDDGEDFGDFTDDGNEEGMEDDTEDDIPTEGLNDDEDDDDEDIYDPEKDTGDDDDEDDDNDEDDDEDKNDKLFGESYVRYSEENKFKIFNERTTLSKNELKILAEDLLQYENDNFRAISESFDLKDIRDESKLQNAHKDYVNAMAGAIALKYKLFK